MQTVEHMNTKVGLFSFNECTRFKVVTGGGEKMLDRFYAGLRKRKRAEYFKRVERRKERAKKQSDKIV